MGLELIVSSISFGKDGSEASAGSGTALGGGNGTSEERSAGRSVAGALGTGVFTGITGSSCLGMGREYSRRL